MSIGSTLGYYRVVIFYYIVGGLTFLPLCAILLVSWFYLAAPIYRQEDRLTQEASTSLGDVDLSEERKRQALDLAVSNAEAQKQAERESEKEEAIGTSTAPASAKRLNPPVAPISTARPHRSGWLVVRRQFESDAIVAALVSQSSQEAANSLAGGAGSDASSSQSAKGTDGDKGPGYMSSLYRGMLKYNYRNNRGGGEQESRKGAEGATGSGASTPDSIQEERRGEKTGAGTSNVVHSKAQKQAAGTGNRESFYCILKASVLYLYSSDDTSNSTTECHAAIDLRSKRVSMYVSGIGDTEGEPDESEEEAELYNTVDTESSSASVGEAVNKPQMKKNRRPAVRDGELFTKRNAIRIVSTAGQHPSHEKRRYAQWFVFCRSATVVEDWYHALLHASMLPESGSTEVSDPIGPVFSPIDMVSLLTSLDTLPDPIPLRWLNALFGRIFFSVYRTAWLEDYVTRKIMKKISRVKTPGFLSDIRVQEVDLGRSPPAFSRPMLKSLTGDGEASMEVAIHYTGSLRLTISTVLTISLGSRFKPYNVPLVLAVIVNSLEGNLLLHIKPPPSNRIWFGFTKLPKMDISVEPVVSERKVQWNMVKKLIEGRIRELLTESLVVPNMDDIPFFDSRPLVHRGGIWSDASKRPDQSTATGAEVASKEETPVEQKSKSTPASVLNMTVSDAADAKTTGIDVNAGMSSEAKRRGTAAGESSSSTSNLSTSPAAAGLSTLLAREMARGQAQTETSETSRPSSSQSSSKRRSWFVGRSNSAMPGTSTGNTSSDSRRSNQQQSSLAWGNASLTLPGASDVAVSSQSAPVSSIDSPMQDARLLSDINNMHEKKDSVSSFVTNASSVASADTEELHSGLVAALNGQAEEEEDEEEKEKESEPLKTPMADVPTVTVQGSTDSQLTNRAAVVEDTWKDELQIPASLSPDQRSLNEEASETKSIASSVETSIPPTTARRSPTHGFAPPPSRGATIRKQQEQRQPTISQSQAAPSAAGVQMTSRQRDRYGLSNNATLDDDNGSVSTSNTPSASLLSSWNKAKASLADKESRQAAAKEAKDALKKGWASWNAKRNGNPMDGATPLDQSLPTSSEASRESSIGSRSRTTSWLASSPPDPASLGVGFDVDADRPSPLASFILDGDEGTAQGAGRSQHRDDEGSSSRASSVSGRAAYRDHRASKEKGLKSGSTSRANTPPLASSAVWDAAVPSVAAPIPVAKRDVSDSSSVSQQQPISSSPSSIRKLSNSSAWTSAAEANNTNYSFVPSQVQATTSISRSDFATELSDRLPNTEKVATISNDKTTSAIVTDSLEPPITKEPTRRLSSGSSSSVKMASPSQRQVSPDYNTKGIKQQPTRAAMMAVPGIPSMQKTSPQSFSAVSEPVSEETSKPGTTSPRIALGTLMARMPSFGGTSNANTSNSIATPTSTHSSLPELEERQEDTATPVKTQLGLSPVPVTTALAQDIESKVEDTPPQEDSLTLNKSS